MAPGNVLCHHNRHLLGNFEFLHGLRMTCVPLNVSEKLHWQHLLEKLRERNRGSSHSCFVNTIQHPRIQKNNINHSSMENFHDSSKQRPPSFFHSHNRPALGRALVHSVGKTHALVVTVELIWLLFLNILSFNFVQTPNESLRFRRFRRSYVINPVVIPTSVKGALLFLLICPVQGGHVPVFVAVYPQCICVTYFS